MPLPQMIAECAFASNPAAAPSWTDISLHLREWATKRGRNAELDAVDLGAATVMFDNDKREFDPTHAGPYNTGGLALKPMRRMRLRAIYGGVTYNVFHGFVEGWPQAWDGPVSGTSTVRVSDGFLPLGKVDVGDGTDWPREFSGARMARILDAAGWPAADRVIDTGYSEIAAQRFELGSGTTALEQLKAVAATELGMFFVDAQARAVFHDRHHRRQSTYLTPAGTFGDALTGGLPYRDVFLDTDSDRIWNDVQVTASGGVTFRSQDSTSQTEHMRRTLARSIPLARDAEAQEQAEYLLSIYKQPRYRLTMIELAPMANEALWPQVLGRELGDHVTVKRWPQGVGSPIVQECSIESIEHRAGGGEWRTRWLLSTPAFSAVDWWLLGDNTFGVLDSTTKLVY